MVVLTLSFALSILGTATPVQDEAQCLPGAKDVIRSPSGNTALRLGQYDPVKEEHHLELVVQDAEALQIHAFGRNVCVAWAPGEKAFALTDNLGSNISETYVVYLDYPKTLENINALLPPRVQTFLRESSHGYVQVSEWVPSGLRLRIWGDFSEPPEAFEMHVSCTGSPKIGLCQPLEMKAN